MKYIIRSYLILFLLVLFSTLNGYSQDLIFTKEGDSIKCKINKIQGENIYFTLTDFGELREAFLPVDKIQYFKYGVFESITPSYVSGLKNNEFSRIRISVNAGPAYRTARLPYGTPPHMEKYYNDLKSGFTIGIESAWYFSEQFGIGLKFNNFRTQNNMDNVGIQNPDGTVVYGTLSQDISVLYTAPYLSSRIYKKNKTSLIFDMGIGLMSYREKYTFSSDKLWLKGNTLCVSWALGYDLEISDKLALGVQIAYFYGYLTKYEISDGLNSEIVELKPISYEKLSRVDLSAGLRFNL